jgi:hypothetical protein
LFSGRRAHPMGFDMLSRGLFQADFSSAPREFSGARI